MATNLQLALELMLQAMRHLEEDTSSVAACHLQHAIDFVMIELDGSVHLPDLGTA